MRNKNALITTLLEHFFLQESDTPDIKKLIEISSPTRVLIL